MAKSIKPKKPASKYVDDSEKDSISKQKLFFERYIQSPKYLERLKNSGYQEPGKVIEARLANLKKAYSKMLPGATNYYDNQMHKVFLDSETEEYAKYPETVKAHEVAHPAGSLGTPKTPYESLNSYDQSIISSRNIAIDAHDKQPTEFKADMDALRYLLRKDKMYDASTQDFTPEVLEKAKLKYWNDPVINRLMLNAKSDEDLIYLMNNIAYKHKDNSIPIAKNGDKIMAKSKNPLKVSPKLLSYEDLPNVSLEDYLMAANGMYMDPGPRIPGLANTILPNQINRELPTQMPQMMYDPSAVITTAQVPPIDTNKAIPQNKQTPPKTSVTPHQKGQKFNAATAGLLGAQALSAMLAENPKKQQVVQPQQVYNPLNYGLGSQALMEHGGYISGEDENNSPSAKNGKVMKSKKKLKKYQEGGGIVPYLFQGMEDMFGAVGDAAQLIMNPASALGGAGGGMPPLPMGKDGHWIQKAVNPAHKGYCTPMTKSTCTPKRKALAKTFKKMAKNRKKDEGGFIPEGYDQYKGGGIIPDNMSNFSPHDYEYGGDVNGCAKVKEVGPNYPNTDLLEQWLLYKNGGFLNKAPNGTSLTTGDPTKPVNNSPIQPISQFKIHNSLAGTNAQADNIYAMDFGERRMSAGIDMINNIVSSGVLPNQTENDKTLRSTLDPQMYTYLYQFNQRPDLKGMTPDQRIQAFYNIPANDPNIQAMKSNMKRYGYGPQEFRRTQSLSQFSPTTPVPTTAKMKSGGVMYDDGGEVQTMWGGSANMESYNPYDGGTMQFDGASHDQGGIGMSYNGKPVEVEGGELASKDAEGNLHIYGNMFIPGTRTKFKKAAKAIAGKEKRYDFLKTKGSTLVNDANPANKFEQLAFNAGKVMMQGGEMGQKDLASKKESLASIQKSMLDMAEMNGLDPFEMSKGKMKKARKGASISSGDPDGNDPTRADRNMNPGNIKYGKFAQKYGAKRDKDGFAIFPDRQTGQKAMQDLLKSDSYKNMSAKEAIRKWTGGNPYRYDLGPLTDKKIAEMDPDELSIVMGTMTKGEGTHYGVTPRPVPGTPTNTPTPKVPTPGPYTPYQIPDIPLNSPTPEIDPIDPVPPYDFLQVPENKPKPSNVEPLGLNNVLGEIYAMATNRVEPVPAQRYEPQLYTPYQVSFQDRANANQSTFNAQARALGGGNPAALGTLASQKYQADQQVYGDEFRTNQAISNDITNKNIALVNDANLKNLGIADTQMVRQSQARSKTREFNQLALNSISDKYAKNSLENKTLAAYENLYDYRFVPTDDGGQQVTYFGPNAMFNYQGHTTPQKAQDVRTISRYDAQGKLKGYAEYDESDLREMQRILDINSKKNKQGLIPRLYGK